MQKKIINTFTVAGITDTGSVRQQNEDNILIDEDLGLLLVADGMGGHEAGEIASMEAIKVIQKTLRLQQSGDITTFIDMSLLESDEVEEELQYLENALHAANQHIFQLNVERNLASGGGMGTTIAGCWLISDEVMLVFHIGDSRLYRFRKQKLEPLTKDHSLLQEWYDSGCIGEKPRSNVILNAMGPYPTTEPEIQIIKFKQKDSFMICSDGLTDMVEDSDIKKKLKGVKAKQVEMVCQSLLDIAIEKGGKDNISIILMTQN